jgi:hypothetical protein
MYSYIVKMEEDVDEAFEVQVLLSSLEPGDASGDVLTWNGATWTSEPIPPHPDPHLLSNGTESAPTYSFEHETNTGVYLAAEGELAFAVGGSKIMSIKATEIDVLPPILLSGVSTPPTPPTDTGYLFKLSGNPDIWWKSSSGEAINLINGGSPDPLLLSNGTAANPTYSFGANTNTGVYRPAADTLGFTAGGVLRGSFDSTSLSLTVPVYSTLGSAGAPVYSFTGDSNTGMFSPGADAVAFATGGTSRMSITTSAINPALPINLLDGSIAAPTLTFSGDTDTGIYHIGANAIGITTGGTARVVIADTLIEFTVPLLGSNGNSTNPGLAFSGNTGTGMYLVDSESGTFGFSSNGSSRMTIGGVISPTVPIQASDGSAGAPAYSFTNDTNMGMYRSDSNVLGFAVNGSSKFTIDTTSGIVGSVPFVAQTGGIGFTFSGDLDTGIQWAGDNTIEFLCGNVYAFGIGTVSILAGLPFYAIDGAVGTPSLTFANDTDTGFYKADDNVLGVAVGGEQTLLIGSSITSAVPFLAPNGNDSSPTYSFSGDTTIGLYKDDSGGLGFTVGGSVMLMLLSGIYTGPPILAPNGSNSVPSYSFASGSKQTGFYAPLDDTIGVTVNSIDTALFDGDGFTIQHGQLLGKNGTSSKPSISFTNQNNGGLYTTGSGDVHLSIDGDIMTFTQSNVTSTVPVIGVNGTVSNPGYAFGSGSGLGMYVSAADTIAFATEGALRMSINSSGITSTVPSLFASGTVSAPSIAFSGDTNTGFYSVGADSLGITAGGTNIFTITTSGTTTSVPIWIIAGAVDSPAYSFVGDTTTGMYMGTPGELSLSAAGTQAFVSTSTYNKSFLPTYFSTGSAVVPSVAFTVDTNTGLYSAGADSLGLSTGGTLRLLIDTTAVTPSLPVRGTAGSVTAPALSFSSDTNTGIYSTGADSIGIATGGTLQLNIDTTSVTSSLVIRGPAGTVTAPALSFSGDTNTGLYSISADSIGIATGGVLQLSIDTTSITSTLPIYTAAGLVTAPSITFTSDTNTGLYSIGADSLGVTTGGTLRLTIDTTALISTLPLRGPAGSVTAPALSFSGDTNTGLYSIGADSLGVTTGGVLQLSIDTTSVTSTLPVYLPDGSVSAPAITFTSDTNTGLYSIGADSLGVSTGGTLRITVNTTSLTSTLPIYAAAGLVATPSITFSGDTNTGLYSIGADSLGVATGGTLRLTIDTTALTATLPLRGSAGSVSAPSLSFSGDNNTGLYSIGADSIGIATGGVLQLSIDTTSVTSTLPIYAASGLVGAPAITFSGDTNTGLYSIGADSLGVTTGGTLRLTIDTTALTSTLPVYLPNGTASAPSLVFASDTNSGIYRVGADSLGISVGGTNTLTVNTTDITSAVQYLAPKAYPTLSYAFVGETNSGFDHDGTQIGAKYGGNTIFTWNGGSIITYQPIISAFAGSTSGPCYTFATNDTTGMYHSGATLKFASGGADILSLNSSSATSTSPFLAPAGSNGAPGFAFSGSTNSGMYLFGNQVKFTQNGSVSLILTPLTVESNYKFVVPNDGIQIGAAGTGHYNDGSGVTTTVGSTDILQVKAGGVTVATGNADVTSGYVSLHDISTPTAPGVATVGRAYKKASDNALYWQTQGGGEISLIRQLINLITVPIDLTDTSYSVVATQVNLLTLHGKFTSMTLYTVTKYVDIDAIILVEESDPDEGTVNSLGTATYSASGVQSLSLTMPSEDGFLQFKVKKGAGMGTNPVIQAMQLVLA